MKITNATRSPMPCRHCKPGWEYGSRNKTGSPMEMDAIINDWKQNAERHDDRNFKFLRSLKMKSKRAVDRASRRLHEEAFSIIDCLKCGNCCKTVSPTLTSEDIAQIATHLGMDAGAFTAAYLTESEDRGLMEPKGMPCPFLADDNRCKIYEVRPTSCAGYPHTDKPELATRSYMHSATACR
jgi:Fe-S-cluster containining protein